MLVWLNAVAAFGLNPLSLGGRAIALAMAAAGAIAALVVSGVMEKEPGLAVWCAVGFVFLASLVCLIPRGRGWSVALATIAVIAGLTILGASITGHQDTSPTVVRIPAASPFPPASPVDPRLRGSPSIPAVSDRG